VLGSRLRGRHALFPPKGEEKEKVKQPARHVRARAYLNGRARTKRGRDIAPRAPVQHHDSSVITAEVHAYVRAALPAPPARVLEVGAGDGTLAAELAAGGYEVVAIDPAGGPPHVVPVPLLELDEPAGSFAAAVAVTSLHHVEPLEASCRHLAELLPPGARLVVDEFDIGAYDERAARWWLGYAGEHHDRSAAEIVAELRDHLHPLATIRATLSPWFDAGEPVRGAYLHRWEIGPEHRGEEERLIAAGAIPATGARFIATRASRAP
jgi:2-polyprenyl-3-methyl-5-hydroxy-6-metoxy-1,4-benzoquinol methylase